MSARQPELLRLRRWGLNARLRAGVVPAMATPLLDDGYSLNEPALGKLIDFLIAAGVSGLFVGGTTGEGIVLGLETRLRLHELAIARIAGRLPALLHVGANTLAEAETLALHAAELGADAIVAVTPYFYDLNEAGLLAYFQHIGQCAPDTPLLAYDIPHLAVNGISPGLVGKLAAELPSFAGLKSSRPDAQQIRQLIDAAPAEAPLWAGNERITLASLTLGAHGLVSGLATAVPEPLVALTAAFRAGNLEEARRRQAQINQILDRLPAGVRIGALKAILSERGIPAGPAVPPRPMPPAEQPLWPAIEALLNA
ncbi:MAG: dihydrodipicolinate synthase family protein [Candidatus Promineifilaceae bacterium]